MGDWYLGEIRAFSFQTVPNGWLQCQGQVLQITQYAALYSLLGAQFGGDGVKTFALPDLRGRTGVSQGVGSTGTQYVVGKNGGAESVAVTVAQLPTHTHVFQGTKADATINAPAGSLLATVTGGQSAYAPYSATSQTTLTPASIGSAGSSAAHENRQPYLALNFCIAAQGTYPQRP